MNAVLVPVLHDVFVPLFSTLVLAGLGWVGAQFQRRTNVKLTEKMQNTLHSAIMTGLLAAMSRGMSSGAAAEAAVDYVLKGGAADSAKKLGATKDVLTTLALAKAHELALARGR